MKEKIEILSIFYKDKDIFESLVDSSNIEFPNIIRLLNKRLYNVMPNSRDLLIELQLDKNLLNKL